MYRSDNIHMYNGPFLDENSILDIDMLRRIMEKSKYCVIELSNHSDTKSISMKNHELIVEALGGPSKLLLLMSITHSLILDSIHPPDRRGEIDTTFSGAISILRLVINEDTGMISLNHLPFDANHLQNLCRWFKNQNTYANTFMERLISMQQQHTIHQPSCVEQCVIDVIKVVSFLKNVLTHEVLPLTGIPLEQYHMLAAAMYNIFGWFTVIKQRELLRNNLHEVVEMMPIYIMPFITSIMNRFPQFC